MDELLASDKHILDKQGHGDTLHVFVFDQGGYVELNIESLSSPISITVTMTKEQWPQFFAVIERANETLQSE